MNAEEKHFGKAGSSTPTLPPSLPGTCSIINSSDKSTGMEAGIDRHKVKRNKESLYQTSSCGPNWLGVHSPQSLLTDSGGELKRFRFEKLSCDTFHNVGNLNHRRLSNPCFILVTTVFVNKKKPTYVFYRDRLMKILHCSASLTLNGDGLYVLHEIRSHKALMMPQMKAAFWLHLYQHHSTCWEKLFL